jgi:signal transduction histidine kinase
MRRFTPATVLIVLVFGAASVLAWQAYQSARSHRQSAERVLTDYVQFAAWELERASQASLEDAIAQWSQPVCGTGGALLTPAEFNARPACKCSDLRAITLFRQAGPELETTGEPLSAATTAWLRSVTRAAPGSLPHRSHALHVETRAGAVRVVVAWTGHTPGGAATPLQGFAMDGAPLERIFRDVVARRPLLPVTLAGAKNDLVVVHVRTSDGGVVYSSGQAPTAPSRVEGRFADAFGGLAYEVRLKPDAAAGLVIGGLPQSRLPVLLGLLGLTGALALAALLQIRREHQLATMRSDFVSSVSHELRTPLAQIRLFSDTLLLNRIRSEAEGRRALEIIQQESRRLTHLVENVLCFSRSERGIACVSPQPMPLGPLVSELVEAFGPLARSGRSDVRLEAPDAIHAHVDPAAFRQILLNLFDNAVKYGRPDQTIIVSVTKRGAMAVVSVADQGPGVPMEARVSIFAPYSRLVTASTSAIAGTGIGLAVVRELVRLHGGDVRVEDAPGGGARFVVELRAVETRETAVAAPARRSLPA